MNSDPPHDTSQDEKQESNLVVSPNGKVVDLESVGVSDFVIGQSASVTTSEVLDPVDVNRDLRDRISFVKNQQLVKLMSDSTSPEVLTTLLTEIAEEISHLKWERRKAAKEGRNTSAYTIARVNGLRYLAETVLRHRESAASDDLDLKSPRLQKIFKIWMRFFYEAMEKSGVSSEVINVVFQQMKADMINWESELRDA